MAYHAWSHSLRLTKSPTVGHPRNSPDRTTRDRLGDSFGNMIPSRVPGIEQPPFYGRLSAPDGRGEPGHAHLSYPSGNGGHDEPPFNSSGTASESSSRSGWHSTSDGTNGNHSLYMPHTRTSRMSQGFPEMNMDPLHRTIAQMASELKWMSAMVDRLVEADKERTRMLGDLLGQVEKLGERVNALEGADGEGRPSKRTGASSGGSNDHPSLKVSHIVIHQWILICIESSASHTRPVL